MTNITGPLGTSARFLTFVAKLKAKHPNWPEVKIRRISSGLSNTNTRRK